MANYLGQGWRALMGVAFIPLYIKYLGVEAYGLIGIFAILQTWLVLLDMGMKPALGREMARFTGGAHNVQSIRDLLRSIEIIGFAIAGAAAFGIWAASAWLASNWVKAENLPVEAVAQAFAVMGGVTALRFIENIYVSSIVGLQRQVLENVVTSIMATARSLGAVAALAWISSTIEAFFIWQGFISLITVALFTSVVYHTLPPSPRAARFSWSALIGIWRFAAGMMAITFLTLLTQVDKILLSRLLTLEAFAYYALAAVVANALNMLTGPVTAAFYPRFIELATRGDELSLRAFYHHGAQLVTVLVGGAAVMLTMFGDRIMLLWTADPALAQQVTPLMTVLALGTLFNALMWMPYQLQLAHGWTKLIIRITIAAVGIQIPAILWIVPEYGAIGAAWVWVTLNAGYLVFAIYLMHRRFLPTEKARWYLEDVALPLAVATAIAALCRWAIPEGSGKMAELAGLLTSYGCVVIGSVLAAPMVRVPLMRLVPGMWHPST